jgi:hypothetical protein
MATIPNGEVDSRAMRVLTSALHEVGGVSTLVEHQEQGVMPALVQACYAIILREEAHVAPGDIADFLGISPGAVSAVFEAPMEAYVQRLRFLEGRDEEFERHTDPDWSGQPLTGRQEPHFVAGALAKFGYDVVRRQSGTGMENPRS